jgi:predicted amidohydrolase YtcJ
LTPGSRFDAVIWDDDLFTTPEDEILQVKVVATVVDGQLAYGRVA